MNQGLEGKGHCFSGMQIGLKKKRKRGLGEKEREKEEEKEEEEEKEKLRERGPLNLCIKINV